MLVHEFLRSKLCLGIVLCQVPSRFFGLKVESPVYEKFLKSTFWLATWNLRCWMCVVESKILGEMRSTCWLYYSKCFTFCQHLQSSQNLCFVNETWWGDSEHHVDARVRVFRLPTEAMFTYLLLEVFAKDSSVMFSYFMLCCWVGPSGHWGMPRNLIHMLQVYLGIVHSSCQEMHNFKICADIF